jgi:tRNA threonylcarbamoyladenosine biosynthesis protein TsaB
MPNAEREPHPALIEHWALSIDYHPVVLILALDTTTPAGSCALASDLVVVREEASSPNLAPAERLPLELMQLLERSGKTLADVDLFAVATGPGSFTGLRIGIATMQGLAFAGGKPLVGISGLDALAEIARPHANDQRIATWVDAWRGEVYAALYDRGGQVEAPVVAQPDTLLSRLSGAPTVFIGDGAGTYRDVILARLGPAGIVGDTPAPLLAGTIARLAASASASGTTSHPHAIRPMYVRRTDAELARDARVSG